MNSMTVCPPSPSKQKTGDEESDISCRTCGKKMYLHTVNQLARCEKDWANQQQ